MSDIVDRINDVHREVGGRTVPEGRARTVLLRRAYNFPAGDVWDACADPERISRWFLPVSGEFWLGGDYRLEGNAGGRILACEPPRLLRVSWLSGPDPGFGEVELRLTPEGTERTVLALEHAAVVPDGTWDRYGPGATGVGWDLTLLGLGRHLRTGAGALGSGEWQDSPEAVEFMTRSSAAWGAAHRASGAEPAAAGTAAQATLAFYVPSAGGEGTPGAS
ncbi:SRPBCC family protein [Streptomyces uncialis]|uniref:SRPBCC family protein n=1 Tax=Streptomyces uncialis TaxID=1048205 RepID=UPI0037AF5CA6